MSAATLAALPALRPRHQASGLGPIPPSAPDRHGCGAICERPSPVPCFRRLLHPLSLVGSVYLPASVPLPVWSAFGSGELDCRYIEALKARTPPLYWILISIFSRRRLCLHHNSQADKNQACSLLLLPPSYCHSWLESPGPTPTVRAMRGQ